VLPEIWGLSWNHIQITQTFLQWLIWLCGVADILWMKNHEHVWSVNKKGCREGTWLLLFFLHIL
jgi:hypothetical protein